MFKALLTVAVVAGCAPAACIGVEGRQILASDLSKADNAFTRLDPMLTFSYSPEVGGRRIIPAAEIDRWAVNHGLENPHSPAICFERTSHSLDVHDVLRALYEIFGMSFEDLRINVIDVCKCQLPPGRLEFALSGASMPPVGHPEVPVLWRGHVLGLDGSNYPVWVRVQVLASITVVRAASNLPARHTLTKQDLEEAKITGSPISFWGLQSIAAYEGKIMNVSLVRGSILRPGFVHLPSDVERGSLVKVAVVNGSAHLALEARAEIAGNAGQTITLTNPAGAARFQANVIGPGRAEIVLAPERFAAAESLEQSSPPEDAVSGRSF